MKQILIRTYINSNIINMSYARNERAADRY